MSLESQWQGSTGVTCACLDDEPTNIFNRPANINLKVRAKWFGPFMVFLKLLGSETPKRSRLLNTTTVPDAEFLVTLLKKSCSFVEAKEGRDTPNFPSNTT